MANAIYTTDSKAMIGASDGNSVAIPNPEANKDVHTIVSVNNGNIGGLFATVLHSYDGTNYKYKLYFLPNKNFNNSLIFADLPGGNGDVIEFKKTTRPVEANRFWYLLQRNIKGSNPEIFTVNDITKIQGNSTTAVRTTLGRGVAQDILAAFYNNKKNVLLIKDILSVDTSSTQRIKNITEYTGKHFKTTIDGSKYVIEIKIANLDEKYLFTQAQANQSHNTRYTRGASESEYTDTELVIGAGSSSPSFPLITTQSRKRWGTNRQNLFFRQEWMKIKANELYSDSLDTRMRVSLIPSLREFIKHINATVANTTANEQEAVAKETLTVASNSLENKIKRDTTETEQKNFSNQDTNEVLLTGDQDLTICLSYSKPPSASYEAPDPSTLAVLNASSYTVGSVDKTPVFLTSARTDSYAPSINRSRKEIIRTPNYGYRYERVTGSAPNSFAYKEWRKVNPSRATRDYPGYFNKLMYRYIINYDYRTEPDRGYLVNFLNFFDVLQSLLSPDTARISNGYYSLGQAEVIKLLQENFSQSRNFLKIPLRTYDVTQKEKYSKLDVQTFSIPGNATSYPTRRFATRDNSENVYIVDEKTDSQTIILKVI
mgnify:CR=1 FL=1